MKQDLSIKNLEVDFPHYDSSFAANYLSLVERFWCKKRNNSLFELAGRLSSAMCLSWCGVKNSSGPLSLLCPGTTLDSSSCGYFSPLSPLFHLTCKGAFAISEVRTRAQQPTVQGSSLCLSRATVTEDSCQPDSHCSACALTPRCLAGHNGLESSPLFCSWHADVGVSNVTHFMLLSR